MNNYTESNEDNINYTKYAKYINISPINKEEFYCKWVYTGLIKNMYYNLDFSNLEEMEEDVFRIGTPLELLSFGIRNLNNYKQDHTNVGTAAWFYDRIRDIKDNNIRSKLYKCVIIFTIARAAE